MVRSSTYLQIIASADLLSREVLQVPEQVLDTQTSKPAIAASTRAAVNACFVGCHHVAWTTEGLHAYAKRQK